jgi:CBS domain-containing protein
MLTLRDVMTKQVLTLPLEMTLRDAIEELAAHRVTGAPVVANGRIAGTLSANDVLAFMSSTPGVPALQERADPWSDGNADDSGTPAATYFTEFWEDAGAEVTQRFGSVDGPEWDVLDEHTVAEAMSTRALLLPPSASLCAAAASMLRCGVHRVLVVNGRELLGIVTTMDVTKAFARNVLCAQPRP